MQQGPNAPQSADGLWDWLVVGAQAGPSAADLATRDDDLDFLDEGPAPPATPQPLRPASAERWQQARQWGEAGDRIGALLDRQTEAAVADLDEAAAWWALRAVATLPAGHLAERGRMAELVRRALLSEQAELLGAACQAVAAAALGHLQSELVAALHRLVQRSAAAEQIDGALLALEQVGDGRCVRPMEALLAERLTGWSEHQAWRARHIVQVIRRGGRR
ncbi:MAG: hypothetical protein HY902_02395 [Deltaproteobacteria bacterium]|nr:hypothetical protein [Deltaproteobacteria bacterium]